MRNKKQIPKGRKRAEVHATVPIRREAHRAAKVACAVSGKTLVSFVSESVMDAVTAREAV